MATVLMMSDTGSIAISQSHTDWPSEQSCRRAVQIHFNQGHGETATLGGRTITIRITATCGMII
jgi:hypothetical protein